MTKRFAIYLMLSSVLMLNAGCVGQLAQTAGEDLGQPLGSRLVNQLPTPPADTPTTVKGGDWCAVMAALGWPKHPTQREVDAMDHDQLVTFDSISRHGEQFCGWKP